MKRITRDDIVAVVVTYFPDDNLDLRLKSVFTQVKTVLIVDNTDPETNLGVLENIRQRGAFIIKNATNIGVAAALNQGIQWAQKQGFNWILTLDQDTTVYPELIELYLEALGHDLSNQNVGVLNTVYRDSNTGSIGIHFGNNKKKWDEVPALITSGSFFSLETYLKTGPFREDFFLDWADHDFCLRARSHGLKNFIHHKPYLDHALGNKTEHHVLNLFTVPTNNHSAFRCYLISRNLIILIRKNLGRELQWCCYMIFYLATKFILVLSFEKNKWQKIKQLTRGLIDGLLNKMSEQLNP